MCDTPKTRICTVCKQEKNLETDFGKYVSGKHRSYRAQPKALWNTYRAGAQKRGLVFELTIEHFTTLFWQKPCHYCGEVLKTAGVDRVDNSLGYTLANVVPCCSVCNFMKLQMSRAEFLAKCEQIVRYQRHG